MYKLLSFLPTTVCFSVISIAGIAVGEDEKSSFDVGPNFKNVQRATKLVGEKVSVNGEKFAVKDLLIDANSRKVLFAFLENESDNQQHVAVKFENLKHGEQIEFKGKLSNEQLEKSSQFAKTKAYTPAIVQAYVSENYGQQLGDDNKDAGEGIEFVTLNKVLRKNIRDKNDKVFGHVTNVVIDRESDKIAYVLIAANTDKDEAAEMPVPLGAFEAFFSDAAWKIDLTAEAILKFPALPKDGPLPTSLDRGWVEYVAVRFGRNSLQDRAEVDQR